MSFYGRFIIYFGILLILANVGWYGYWYWKLGPRTYERASSAYLEINLIPGFIGVGVILFGGFCIALAREIKKKNESSQ